jgi:hypothetical protein
MTRKHFQSKKKSTEKKVVAVGYLDLRGKLRHGLMHLGCFARAQRISQPKYNNKNKKQRTERGGSKLRFCAADAA